MARNKARMKAEGVFTCDADAEKRSAEVHLYGEIGMDWFGDGVDPTEFVKTIDGLDVDQLTVFVNSPGGDAYGGIAMMNSLRRQKAHVDVVVDGIAASAASYIALGGDTLTMGRNSQMMVHDAAGMCFGQAADMDKMSEALSKLSDSVAAAYAEKAGGTTDEWRDIMRAETWYTADEAVKAGLADGVDDSRSPDDSTVQDFDLHFFNYAGRENAPAPVFPEPRRKFVASARVAADSPAEPESITDGRKADMAFMDDVRARLGLPDADEAGMLAALDKLKSKPDIPEGVELIDHEQLESLKDRAETGAMAIAREESARRAGIVDKAIADGKIPPARRDNWLALMDADEEGAVQVLDKLAAGTIPTEPIGYVGGVDEAPDADEALYKKLAHLNVKEA